MIKCKVCKSILTGRQTKFCSDKCKSKSYNSSLANDEDRFKKNKTWRDSHKKEISNNKKSYYQKHRAKLLAIRKKYAQDHPEVDRAYKQSVKGRFMMYRRGAKKRDLVFEFTLEDFKDRWNKTCHYCGEKVDGIGIDRIDNSIGYTKENTVNCCFMCNRMKHAFTKEDFINKCNQIAKYGYTKQDQRKSRGSKVNSKRNH